MEKINSNKFKIMTFLGGFKEVKSLKDGAAKYGGATKFDNGIYSNTTGNKFIELKQSENEISVFVPSTIETDKATDNKEQIKKSIDYLNNYYDISKNLKFYKTKGSWYSEDLKEVIIESITIITLKLDKLTEKDINIFIELAKNIKEDMSQEGVSININGALAII